MVKLEVGDLPKPATLVGMVSEMKGLACVNIMEGFKYQHPDSAYSLGLSEMLTGSADVTLNTSTTQGSSADLSVPEYIVGCKSLEIINKVILECRDITILDRSQRLQTLLSCLNEWSVDASSVVSGEAVVFDSIHASLFTLREYDDTVEEILCMAREKENLTQSMMVYGLWQTEQQVKEGLMKLKSKTNRLQALKAQLDFRTKVLE